MPPCLTLSNKGWIGGKALLHTVMSRGCTCTLSRLTSLKTGDRLLPYGSGILHLLGLEIVRPETRLKDYLHVYARVLSEHQDFTIKKLSKEMYEIIL